MVEVFHFTEYMPWVDEGGDCTGGSIGASFWTGGDGIGASALEGGTFGASALGGATAVAGVTAFDSVAGAAAVVSALYSAKALVCTEGKIICVV